MLSSEQHHVRGGREKLIFSTFPEFALVCVYYNIFSSSGWSCSLTLTGRCISQILELRVDNEFLCTGEDANPSVGMIGEVIEDVWRHVP